MVYNLLPGMGSRSARCENALNAAITVGSGMDFISGFMRTMRSYHAFMAFSSGLPSAKRLSGRGMRLDLET